MVLAERLHKSENGKVYLLLSLDDILFINEFQFYTPLYSTLWTDSPMSLCKSLIFKELIEDSLQECASNAGAAGLNYSIDINTCGLFISVAGFNDKLPELFRNILEHSKRPLVLTERANIVRKEVRCLLAIVL